MRLMRRIRRRASRAPRRSSQPPRGSHERRIRAARGRNTHRGTQVLSRGGGGSYGGGAGAAGDCAALYSVAADSGFAAAGDDLFWIEPAKSFNGAAAWDGDRSLPGRPERADCAAGILRYREDRGWISGVFDRGEAGYGTSRGAFSAHRQFFCVAPGAAGADAAIAVGAA